MTPSKDYLIWIDLEMTGLDTQNDQIIEIATIVTDNNLEEVAEGPVMAICCAESLLAGMDDWNRTQHGKSGLLERVRKSDISLAEAEQRTLSFLEAWILPNTSPMCGNSICQDRRFLHRLMPRLEAFFHYRNLDVSTVKELAGRWAPAVPRFEKDSSHLALSDIRDSIAELRHYRSMIFSI
jgi:oligoribonuclease